MWSIVLTQDGFYFRRILPRALQAAADTNKNDRLREGIGDILQSAMAIQTAENDDDDAADPPGDQPAQRQESMQQKIDSLLEQILSGDHKSAQQNLSRLKSCAKFFNLPSLPNSVSTTSAFVEPIEFVVNRLLKRSALLLRIPVEQDDIQRKEYEIEWLGKCIILLFKFYLAIHRFPLLHKIFLLPLMAINSRSRTLFFEWVSGELGEMSILLLVSMVEDTGNPYWQHLSADDCSAQFGQSVWVLGDLWRRLCLEVLGHPHTTFCLYGLPLDEFIDAISKVLQEYRACRRCIDTEFTEVILSQFGPLLEYYGQSLEANEALSQAYAHLQDLLKDMATLCPISSDLVECINGNIQSRLHSSYRHTKQLTACSEESLLNSVRSEHKTLIELVRPHYLPPNAGKITAKAGNRHASKHKRELTEEDRLQQASARKVRKLSGCLDVLTLLLNFHHILDSRTVSHFHYFG